MYRGKNCEEKFLEYTEDEIKWLFETTPRQLLTGLTDLLKWEQEAAEKCHNCFKYFNGSKNQKVQEHCHCTGFK